MRVEDGIAIEWRDADSVTRRRAIIGSKSVQRACCFLKAGKGKLLGEKRRRWGRKKSRTCCP